LKPKNLLPEKSSFEGTAALYRCGQAVFRVLGQQSEFRFMTDTAPSIFRRFLKAGSETASGAIKESKVDDNELIVPRTKIPVVTKSYVIVVGAGPAGFGAAVSAAQCGADTLLIEKCSISGGNLVSGLTVMGAEDKVDFIQSGMR
jgi:hypothetical protein